MLNTEDIQTNLLCAQDLVGNCSAEYASGFNSRIMGYDREEAFGYPSARNIKQELGFYYACQLIEEGKVYYRHRFRHKSGSDVCGGYSFPYGGFWVCEKCNKKSVDKDWWIVKVYQDGNAWFCVGLGFENLQESSNFAFGETKEKSLDNYEALFLKLTL